MNQKITEVLAEMREWDFNCGAERNPYARPDRDDVMGWADEIEQALAAKDADGVRYEEDAYVIGEMGGLLAQIAVIVNGPAPELVYWRYHDLPEKVQALKDCASQQPEVADAARVIEWARDPNRKAATQAFTAGADRQAAYWIEWAESQAADHVADGGGGVPSGWKLAPVEADAKMIDAGVAMALQVNVHGEGGWSKYIAGLWRQMMKHAPDAKEGE